jgi:hypothetical protein
MFAEHRDFSVKSNKRLGDKGRRLFNRFSTGFVLLNKRKRREQREERNTLEPRSSLLFYRRQRKKRRTVPR